MNRGIVHFMQTQHARTAGKTSQSEKKHRKFSITTQLRLRSSAEWMRARNTQIYKRFQQAVADVPAYTSFLKKQHFEPTSVRGGKDVTCIPPISKQNYLRAFPWKELITRNGLTEKSLVLTATSGSTGQPFYIPRTDELHDASAVMHKLFLERSGLDPMEPTLVMVCFGMGVWIGGLLTYEAFRRASATDWPLTVITPGVSKKEIFDTLERIGPAYTQLILCGYPPFIKDLLDDGASQGIRWRKWDMRIVCAAEAFSERFRDYLLKKTGMKDPYRSVMNIYGSAELGTMATETPLSILLRRLALNNNSLYRKLFSEAHRLPTLAQFVPDFTAFEAGEDGTVYATAGSVLPFVRYSIGDQGGVFTYDDAQRWCAESGMNLRSEITRAGIADTVTELPFVYLYERADLSTKLYGAIIFPEHVKVGLQDPAFEKVVTGRFTMTTEHDANHNEYLEVNVELQHGVEDDAALREALSASIVKSLSASSGEYQNNRVNMGDRVSPRVVLWQHEDPKYFNPSIKQKWVLKPKDGQAA